MLFSLGLFALGFSAAFGENGRPDVIRDHLVKFINPKVAPCDNFYRHVCPREITTTEVPIAKIFTTEEINKFGSALGLDSFSPIGIFVRTLEAFIAKNDSVLIQHFMDLNRDRQMSDEVKLEGLKKVPDFLRIFLSGLLQREVWLKLNEERKLLDQDDYIKVKKEIHTMIEVLIDQIEKTPGVSDRTKHEYKQWAENTLVITGSANEITNRSTPEAFNHTRLYGRIERIVIDSVIGGGNLNDPETVVKILMKISDYLEDLATFNPMRFNAIPLVLSWNAAAHFEMRTIHVSEAAILMSKGVRPAARHGLSMVYGHELMHTLFQGLDHYDPKVNSSRHCLANYARDVCEEYVDEEWTDKNDCHATMGGRRCTCRLADPAKTFEENIADQEGLQLAYLSMVKELGEGKLKESAYPEEPTLKDLTNEQVFFYAWASVMCLDHEMSQYMENDPHPAHYVRINSAFSLSKAFMKAFDCPSDSRMAKTLLKANPEENCNQIGQPVRRLLSAKN